MPPSARWRSTAPSARRLANRPANTTEVLQSVVD